MSLKGVFFLVWLSVWGLIGWTIWQEWPDQFVHIVTCDVGQGDGILISQGFNQILIDAGADTQILDCLNAYMPFWDQNVEIVIATHADHDHIGGMPMVFSRFRVSRLLLTGQVKESDDFEEFSDAVRKLVENGTQLHFPRLGEQIRLGSDVNLTCLWPEIAFDLVEMASNESTETQLSAYFSQKGEGDEKANDGSIALFLEFGTFTFLTTGDLEEHPESTLVEWGLIKDIDVLKAGHHGSKTSSIAPFLTAARPEFTLISNGKNNRYGHPHTEVLHRLEEVGSQILRTDQLGHIELISDGQDYWFFHRITRKY